MDTKNFLFEDTYKSSLTSPLMVLESDYKAFDLRRLQMLPERNVNCEAGGEKFGKDGKSSMTVNIV